MVDVLAEACGSTIFPHYVVQGLPRQPQRSLVVRPLALSLGCRANILQEDALEALCDPQSQCACQAKEGRRRHRGR